MEQIRSQNKYSYLVTHQDPHAEEIADKFAIVKKSAAAEEIWPGISHAKLVFVPDANNVDAMAEYIGKSVFLGIGNSVRRVLIERGVSEIDIIDEHSTDGSGRASSSSLAMLLNILSVRDVSDLEDGEPLNQLFKIAEQLAPAENGEGRPAFDVASIIKAIHDFNPGSQAAVAWWTEVLNAIYNDREYFRRNERIEAAGVFFEKIACMWALYRSGTASQNHLIETYFPRVGVSQARNFEEVLRTLGKTNDRSFLKIRQFVANGCEKMPNPLSLPRMMHCLANQSNLERAIILSFQALDAKRDEQFEFLEAENELRPENVSTKEIEIKGVPALMLHVVSDNRHINDAARSLAKRKKVNLAVVLQENTSGHLMIFSGTMPEISLAEVAKSIRLRELALYDVAPDYFPEDILKAAGTTCGVTNVTYLAKHRNASGDLVGSEMILSRSRSYPGSGKWLGTKSADAKAILVEKLDETKPVAVVPPPAEKKARKSTKKPAEAKTEGGKTKVIRRRQTVTA
jgi:hypothetical protein